MCAGFEAGRRQADVLSPRLKSAIKTHLPRGLNLGPAVVQLFLNDGRCTRLGVANFPSFFAPEQAAGYHCHLRVFDAEGREIASTELALPPYAATEVDLSAAFGQSLPHWGMVAARIYPSSFFSLRDRHLGRIRPHFFTLYADEGMRSIGLVHPQTNLGARAAPERQWLSNLEVDPAMVQKLELFQVNPGDAPVESEAFVQTQGGTVVAAKRHDIPSHGTRRVVFDLSQIAIGEKTVSVGLRGLAAANGKPILFLHFRDGSFTCCHA